MNTNSTKAKPVLNDLRRLRRRIEKGATKLDEARGERNDLIRDAVTGGIPRPEVQEAAGVTEGYVRKCLRGEDRVAG
jgi:hypothetical protein